MLADTCCISLFLDVCITMLYYRMTYCESSLNTHKRTFQSQHSPYPTPQCWCENLNSTVELLDLQALTIIPQKWKEAISEPFKGWREIFYSGEYNTLCTQCRGGISNKVLTDSVGFFQHLSISAKWPSIIDSCSHCDQICEWPLIKSNAAD